MTEAGTGRAIVEQLDNAVCDAKDRYEGVTYL
jgi:hypothetical protein